MSKSVPKYSLHKATGQARVRFKGKDIWLGKFGTPESHRRYAEFLERWQRTCDTSEKQITVGQLSTLYLRFAERHYRKDGKVTSEVSIVRRALRWLNSHCRKLLLRDFGPKQLKAIRELIIEHGNARTTVNKFISRIRMAVKWAVSEELCDAVILVGLQSVRDLQRGRSEARETDPIKPAPEAHVDALYGLVSEPVWAMIELQRLTGMRPGEVLQMRTCDINTSGKIWEYVPQSHKLEHHGKERIVFLGPQAQAILRDWLREDLQAYLFSSKSSGTKPYTRAAYTRAIARACEQADVPRWSPNQLRHLFATHARRTAGIEAASASLGHSNLRTTEVYAERSADSARAVVARIG